MKILALYNQKLEEAQRIKAGAKGADWIDRDWANQRLASLEAHLGDLAHCCIALGDRDVTLDDIPVLREQFKARTLYGRNHWWMGLHLIEDALRQ